MDITKELNWLESWIKARLTLPTNSRFEEIYNECPLSNKVENRENNEESLFFGIELTIEEKLVALLTISPFLIPAFLNSLINTEKKESLNVFPAKVDNSAGNLIPTFETAIFLLAGTNIQERRKYLSLFGSKSQLFSRSLINSPETRYGLPFTHALLTPGPTIINKILMDNPEDPEFSHDFPATLLSSNYDWDELIVDSETKDSLEEVKQWLEYEDILSQDEKRFKKFTPGYKCLFYGPPGTGKSLAAALIGKLTGHKVYRIDLSAVVSKYIGETEKNLAKVFDRADHGKWILFFDEADALFGKRAQTQSAHDRYANQEVSYLLQRFETYKGVAILATNFKDNIDKAFSRRFHNMISFKAPDVDERLKLWQIFLPEGFLFNEEINLIDISNNVKINGAGIYNVMRRSVMKTVLRKEKIINGSDLLDSVKLEFAKENKTL